MRKYGASATSSLAMKPGTPLTSLAVVKGQDAPVVKEREEYPSWVATLATPPKSLAALRKIPNDEAKDEEIMRFLKLNRRQSIRNRNEQAAN